MAEQYTVSIFCIKKKKNLFKKTESETIEKLLLTIQVVPKILNYPGMEGKEVRRL